MTLKWKCKIPGGRPYLCASEPTHSVIGQVYATELSESMDFCIQDAFLSPYFCNFIPGSSREVGLSILLLIYEKDFGMKTQKENFKI